MIPQIWHQIAMRGGGDKDDFFPRKKVEFIAREQFAALPSLLLSLARSLAKVAVDPPISGSAAPASLEVAWNVGAAAAALSGQKLLACGRGGRYKGSFEAISRSIRAPE